MKIREVKSHLVNVGSRNLSFVRIDTDEGISGVGEGTATYGAGTLGVDGAIRELAPLIIGEDPFNIELLCETLRFKSFWGKSGGPYIGSAISGIEQGLWDIKGKALNTPVYELLGGCVRDKIRVYANVWATVGFRKPEEYVEFALKVIEDGFTAIKIYPFGVGEVTKDEEQIIDRVLAVREAIGDKVDLMIDGGWRYSQDTLTAIRIGRRLEKFHPLFYEEPIDPDNIDALAKVASNVKIPIAAGERIYTKNRFREYLDKKALEILQPDIGIAGGILELKKIATIAETYSATVAPHNCSGPVATAATLQLVACTRNFLIQEIFPYEEHWQDLVDEAPEKKIKDGYIEVSRKPGLGIELNDEAIRKHPYKPVIPYAVGGGMQ